MPTLGDFEHLSDAYAKGRRGYPKELYQELFQYVQEGVLDIGCGTGISTRELVQNGFKDVVGVDRSASMLAEARKQSSIEYVQAEMPHLPFASQTFNLATCFSAFHWFTKDTPEIKRILRPHGYLAVINKDDKNPFKDLLRKKIGEYLGVHLPHPKENYHPLQAIESNGLKVVKQTSFTAQDAYSPDEALSYYQSVSFWNLIPDDKKQACIENVLKPLIKEHSLVRHYEVSLILSQI